MIFLETVNHQGLRGYGTFCHMKNPDKVFKKIDEWRETISRKEVKVKVYNNVDVYLLSELKENLCLDYYKRFFEKQSKKEPVVLPEIINGTNTVVDTMKRWCSDTNKSSDSKGLIVHDFNLSEYFRKLFCSEFEKGKLLKDLDIEYVPTTPVIIVYNPKENVILLIRMSRSEEFRKETEFCSHDIKMFLLLFGDEVKRRRVKVISLLASYETANEISNCKDCNTCIVSFEILKSYKLFQTWFHNHAEDFNIINTFNIDEKIIIAASAKLIGCLAAAPYLDNLPTFTNNENEQMKHALNILTSEQKEILYSGDKHLIIQGPYGSGKSVIACKKFELLLNELDGSKKNDLVYFICFDSKSAFLSEIGKGLNRENVRLLSNKAGKKFSEILKGVLEETSNESIHIFMDEYDGESLDIEEATILNDIFVEKFRDSIVFLVTQSMEKRRHISVIEKSAKDKKNMFELLTTMKNVYLNTSMRNSVEIFNLIRKTENILQEEETRYQHPREVDTSKDAVSASSSKSKSAFKIKSTESSEKSTSQVENQKQLNTKEFDVNVVIENMDRNMDHKEDQEAFGTFGLDEAFDRARMQRASKNDTKIIVNKFTYRVSRDIGHGINSNYPGLFEVDFDKRKNDSFEKILVLNCVFDKLKIWYSNSNNKHVILHFDTSTNRISNLLAPAIEYHEKNNIVTNNYEAFKYRDHKSILVCYFRLMRGLEHTNVTIVIDQDFYSMQHYLVEAMARCTSKLNIVVLEKSDAMSRIVEQWKCGLKEQQLVDHWKVKISSGEKKEPNYQEHKELITINGSSKDHEKMRQIFDQHLNINRPVNNTRDTEEYIQNW